MKLSIIIPVYRTQDTLDMEAINNPENEAD